jgi:adenylate cyclase
VVAVVEPKVRRAEIDRARKKHPGSLDAYDLYLKAQPDLYQNRPEPLGRAIELLERAVELDPSFAPAVALAGFAYLNRHNMQLATTEESDVDRGLGYARAALRLGSDDPVVTAYAGFLLLHLGAEYDTGLVLIEGALVDNPNSSIILGLAGIGHLLGGELVSAKHYLERALSLNPHEFGAFWQLSGTAHALMAEGRYEEALGWATRSDALNAEYDATLWMLISANAFLGRMDEAQRHLARLEAISPGVSIARIRRGQHSKDPHRIDILVEGMRLAGMPEA